MTEQSTLITEAQKWVGYLEKRSNSSLTHFSQNAGSQNFTYFADWMSRNADKNIYANGYAWCDTFVDFCFCRAFGIKRAYELLGGWSAYTPTSSNYLRKINSWYPSPKAGDIIFFQNDKRIHHTGIVYKVDAFKVYTIEGNTTAGNNTVSENVGCVARKAYLLSNRRIAGYGRPNYIETTSLVGIDVSSYQGTIHWPLVASAKVAFAILRGVLKNGTMDAMFETNYEGCLTNKIPCLGVYQFSYALTEETAIADAQNMIDKLNGKKLPIWLDLEWASQGALGKDKVTSIAAAYVTACESLGYRCHIYSNLDWYKNKFHPDKLSALGCKFWIARYPASDNGACKESLKPGIGEVIWQYSSKGKVNGISGHVDMNITNAKEVSQFP